MFRMIWFSGMKFSIKPINVYQLPNSVLAATLSALWFLLAQSNDVLKAPIVCVEMWLFNYCNMNLRDGQRKMLQTIEIVSSLMAPWQNGPYKNKQLEEHETWFLPEMSSYRPLSYKNFAIPTKISHETISGNHSCSYLSPKAKGLY